MSKRADRDALLDDLQVLGREVVLDLLLHDALQLAPLLGLAVRKERVGGQAAEADKASHRAQHEGGGRHLWRAARIERTLPKDRDKQGELTSTRTVLDAVAAGNFLSICAEAVHTIVHAR